MTDLIFILHIYKFIDRLDSRILSPCFKSNKKTRDKNDQVNNLLALRVETQ